MRPDHTRHCSLVVLTTLLCALFVLAGPARGAEPAYTVRMQPLPGASGAGILMDYIAFDPATGMVWAPAGNTGTVAVVDPASGKVRTIDGFATAEMGTGERKRKVGPSSVTAGPSSPRAAWRAAGSPRHVSRVHAQGALEYRFLGSRGERWCLANAGEERLELELTRARSEHERGSKARLDLDEKSRRFGLARHALPSPGL